MSRAISPRPPWTVMQWHGLAYLVHLYRIRRALVEAQARGEMEVMAGLAVRLGISRTTVTRFFAGQGCALQMVGAIVKELGLEFGEVCWEIPAQSVESVLQCVRELHRTRGIYSDPRQIPGMAEVLAGPSLRVVPANASEALREESS